MLALVVALLAVSVSQTPPPSIAEFSPQAVAKPETAEEQAGEFGLGEGGPGGGGGPDASTTTTTDVLPPEVGPPIVKPRQKLCVGTPPRQIEDPQSPPCVDAFVGDNGGATSQGVTANEIQVAVFRHAALPPAQMEALRTFFNTRFQLYGRKITFQYLEPPAHAGDDLGQQAAAAQADVLQVFAGIGSYFASTLAYYEALAREKIVFVSPFSTFGDAQLERMAPYGWQYQIASDRNFTIMGQWACSRLVGKKAVHAAGKDKDGVDLASQPRKFAIFMNKFRDDGPGPDNLRAALGACGVSIDNALVMIRPRFGTTPESDASDVAAMKSAKVTSVLCICFTGNLNALMTAAGDQGFQPEWVGTSYGGLTQNDAVRAPTSANREQRSRLFSLLVDNKRVPPTDEPFCVAMRESKQPCDAYALQEVYYRTLLVLASGIQMAGPNLTPKTFEAGLRGTAFPNPPYYTQPARASFTKGYSMLSGDSAEVYWRDGAVAPDGQTGAFCTVAGGKRYEPGTWPTTEAPFFPADDANGARCDSGVNPQRPAT